MNVNLTQPILCLLFICLLSACKDESEITPIKLPQDTQELKNLLNKDTDADTRLAAYYQLYKNYRYTDLTQAAHYANQQRGLAEQLDNTLYLGRAYHALGTLQEQSAEYIEAVNAYLHAIDAFEEIGYNAGVATDFNYLGLVFLHTEGYKDAIQYFEKATKTYREIGDLKNLSDTYANLAICQYKLKNYTIAFDNISKAIDCQYKVDTNDKEFLAYLYNVAGNIKYLNKQYNDALEHYNQAWMLEGVSNEIKADIAHNFVNTYMQKGEAYYSKAETWLNEAKIYQGQSTNIENQNLVRQYNIEGCFYQSQGNYVKAIEIFEHAIDMANTNIINEPLVKTLALLTASYRASNSKVDNSSFLRIIDVKDQQLALKENFANGLNPKALQAALNQEVEAHNNRKLQASMEAQQWVIFRYGAVIVAGLLVLLWAATKQKRKWALASRQWEASTHELENTYQEIANENQKLKSSYEHLRVQSKSLYTDAAHLQNVLNGIIQLTNELPNPDPVLEKYKFLDEEKNESKEGKKE